MSAIPAKASRAIESPDTQGIDLHYVVNVVATFVSIELHLFYMGWIDASYGVKAVRVSCPPGHMRSTLAGVSFHQTMMHVVPLLLLVYHMAHFLVLDRSSPQHLQRFRWAKRPISVHILFLENGFPDI